MPSMARRPQAWASADALLELDEGYAQVLSLLDRRTAFRAILDRLPGDIGVDVAWIGEVDASGDIVLGHAVRTRTDAVDGLVVPPGVGLGGLVMQTGRPAWVADYPSASDLSRQFSRQAEREGVRGMIAVPLVHGGRPLGVLYAADRAETHYGDLAVTALEVAAARAANAAVVAERARHSAEVAVLEERRRLAMQLHDTVGAMLFTIGAGVRSLGDDLARQPDLRARLETIERQAAEAAAVFRESLDALHAPPEAVALAVALRADSRGFEERTGIPVRLLVLDELPPLHASRSGALASAVREALLNVEKHAQRGLGAGERVRQPRRRRGRRPRRRRRPSAEGRDGGGLGLAAATERLERVGGHLTMGRNDDGGVTVQAWVPE